MSNYGLDRLEWRKTTPIVVPHLLQPINFAFPYGKSAAEVIDNAELVTGIKSENYCF